MPMIASHYSHPRRNGFSLIEVMVSLFILAGGMLGMAALQNQVIKNNHAAFTESQAIFLINDMAERIRANRGNDAYVIDYPEPTVNPGTNCSTSQCSSNQMVAWDLYQWRLKIEDQHTLPQGQSQIIYDSLARTFTISIRFDWSHLGGVDLTNDGMRTVTMTTRI